MQLIKLDDMDQLQQLIQMEQPLVVFKHNSSCSISKGVLSRLQAAERLIQQDTIRLIDIQSHRPLSDLIAISSGVPHQSPQILVFRNGHCIYHEWGYSIDAEKIADALET
jgi:bacillithiol system protein YtxJ